MPYKYLEVELLRVEDLSDFKKPIDIFNAFIDSLRNDINGSNFNKYYDPRDPHPCIHVRIDFDTGKEDLVRRKILEKATELSGRGLIRRGGELRDWTEPSFVVRAHELGTDFAVKLRSWMERNQDVYLRLQESPTIRAGFMAQLVYLVLKHAGFEVPLYWNSLRLSPTYDKDRLRHEERVDNLADECADGCKEKLKDMEKQLVPDFLERFFHAFFNCTYSGIEEQVKKWLAESFFWKRIAP